MRTLDLHHVRRGSGPPLLLIHGLGSSWRSWDPILPALEPEREVIAVDLPGFGETPPLAGEVSIATLADALEGFLTMHELDGVDVVGSSMGARLALELARRGCVGATVALDPGGFWTARQRRIFGASVGASVRLVRALAPVLPMLTGNPVGRTLLFGQFSARPWRLDPDAALRELRSFDASPSLDAALRALVQGPPQAGMALGAARGPIVIGWGRRDLVCLPSQAARAMELFPDARLHWFEACGHFPQWDVPEQTSRLILESTARQSGARSSPTTVRNRMSKNENIAAQEHLAENINAGKVDVAVETFAQDAVDHDPAQGQGPGREGFKAFFTALTTAFPDAHVEPAHVVADDEHVAIAYTLTGTHRGDFNGVAPTGKMIEVRGVQIGRFENGKIVERWGSSDELGILKQLGVDPTAG